jgi:hypothetical protein
MKPWIGASTGLSHWARLASIGALALCAAPQAARAQYYFRPYGHLVHQPFEEAPRFASRRAVAAIVAHEGFRLVGPLGERGDQIVATGVDGRGRWMRFVIDPYEGEVLSAKFIVAPTPAEGADPDAPAGRKPAGIGAPTGKPPPARGSSHRAITPPPPAATTTAAAPAAPPAPAAPDAKTTPAAPPDATATIPAPVAPAAAATTAAPAAPPVSARAGSILPPIASTSPLLDVTHAEAARRQPAPEKTPEATPALAPHDGG